MTCPPASSAAALRAGGTNVDPGWVRGAPREEKCLVCFLGAEQCFVEEPGPFITNPCIFVGYLAPFFDTSWGKKIIILTLHPQDTSVRHSRPRLSSQGCSRSWGVLAPSRAEALLQKQRELESVSFFLHYLLPLPPSCLSIQVLIIGQTSEQLEPVRALPSPGWLLSPTATAAARLLSR